MINPNELRLGNYLLQKIINKIVIIKCTPQHIDLLFKEEGKDFYPVVLKADLLEKSGFTENKNYPLLPDAREFILILPVIGNSENEIRAYIKNNKECFGRAMVKGLVVSNNFYHLHQLQNLYYALTGEDLKVNDSKGL